MRANAPLPFLAALIAAVVCLPNPAAADDKPVVSIKTRTIEASVAIEKELKAYPGLYGNLLAEGRRELAKWRAYAEKDRKEMPDIFRNGRHYSYDRTYTRRSAIGRYISIERADFVDGGGAHPNTTTNTILWDADARKRISIRPFFKETADNGATLVRLATAIRAAVVAEKKAHDVPPEEANDEMWLGNIKPQLLKIGAVALAPSTERGKSAGLLFYFSPYAIGPYAEGAYTVFVPWAVFKGHPRPPAPACSAAPAQPTTPSATSRKAFRFFDKPMQTRARDRRRLRIPVSGPAQPKNASRSLYPFPAARYRSCTLRFNSSAGEETPCHRPTTRS
jgi:hypothetical protein